MVDFMSDDIFECFIKQIEMLKKIHDEGNLYCVSTEIWKEKNYHKNLVYYSPRIRKQILSNQEFEILEYDDLYYLLIEFYIKITGYTPPPYFRMNRTWIKKLKIILSRHDSESADTLISLFKKCLFDSSNDTIKTVHDLMETKEFTIMFTKTALYYNHGNN